MLLARLKGKVFATNTLTKQTRGIKIKVFGLVAFVHFPEVFSSRNKSEDIRRVSFINLFFRRWRRTKRRSHFPALRHRV